MTHKQFHEHIQATCRGKYCSTDVSVTSDATGNTTIRYRAYVDGHGWSEQWRKPEDAIDEMSDRVTGRKRPEQTLSELDATA